MRTFISTIPFGEVAPEPIDRLKAARIDFQINPTGRKLQPREILNYVDTIEALIAGTELLDEMVFQRAPLLKIVARVGIGVDNVDLVAAERRGILVTNTPDAPTKAVAELTVGLALALLRQISVSDREIRDGQWRRVTGRRLAQSTVGIVGVGRVGATLVGHLLGGFPGVRILAHDIRPEARDSIDPRVLWVDQDEIFANADIVTIHVPLDKTTKNLVDRTVLERMKPDAVLINTARGGIVNESALYDALRGGTIRAAAMDVFEAEPYAGPLAELQNCLLTPHQGSMTEDCRLLMELGAVDEVVRFAAGLPPLNPVHPDTLA